MKNFIDFANKQRRTTLDLECQMQISQWDLVEKKKRKKKKIQVSETRSGSSSGSSLIGRFPQLR